MIDGVGIDTSNVAPAPPPPAPAASDPPAATPAPAPAAHDDQVSVSSNNVRQDTSDTVHDKLAAVVGGDDSRHADDSKPATDDSKPADKPAQTDTKPAADNKDNDATEQTTDKKPADNNGDATKPAADNTDTTNTDATATNTDDPNAKASDDKLEIGGDANNMQNGYTFAGFSPQDHQGADLNDWHNYKYTAYNYLVKNKIDPNRKDWAPEVAAGLNKKYNTDVFKAQDGETLMYGDEYIHSDHNGHGMLPGTYNPDAKGEFLWGSTTPDPNAGGGGGGNAAAPAAGGGNGGAATPAAPAGGDQQNFFAQFQQWEQQQQQMEMQWMRNMMGGGMMGGGGLGASSMGMGLGASSSGMGGANGQMPPWVKQYAMQLMRHGVPPHQAIQMAKEKFHMMQQAQQQGEQGGTPPQ